MNAITKMNRPEQNAKPVRADQDYLSFTIGNQMFGVPVLKVQDVLNTRALARIPLAPKEVAGSLNLRGRIVTAIDMRRRLDLADAAQGERHMSIVVDHQGELYSLVVDGVGEVLQLTAEAFEPNPATLNASWKDLSLGVFQLRENLLIILDVERLLAFSN